MTPPPPPRTTPRLYQDLAHLWPILSPPEDYTAEAQIILDLLEEHFGTDRRLSILELGAGGGHTLYHLKHHHDCTASDLSPDMLEQCKKLNPEVPTHLGDMRSLRLDQTFDAILIHDAIDYLLTEEDIRQTLRTASEHLNPDGMLVLAPTETTETLDVGSSASDERETETHTYRFTSTLDQPEPPDRFRLTLDIEITDRTTGETQRVTDHHTCGLFPQATWLALLHDHDFLAMPRETELAWSCFTATRQTPTSC